ncbi:MAG: hypothetical protein KGM44_02885 [bacterium]|nr:hypothetical protein [bacterium]
MKLRLLLASLAMLVVLASAWMVARAADTKGADPPGAFFMFTTSRFANAGERKAIVDALRRYVTGQDYLGSRLGHEVPELGGRVGRAHLYALPPNLESLERQSAGRCGSGTPGLIVYDGEHWQETPADEQEDMPRAIARGKGMVRATGCHDYGVAPDGEFIGIVPKTCSYELGDALHRRVDWDDISLFNIQAQRLLSDECDPRAGLKAYVTFVTEIARDVRAKSPRTKVSAQLSFRYTPPDRMVAAIRRLRGVVDGFYIAYPSNVGPRCAYCSPHNLEEVLEAIRAT